MPLGGCRANGGDPTLLKGAVFFVGAALWSPRAVGSLQYPAAGVLPSLGRALAASGHPSVAYEAAVCLQWLLPEGGPPLPGGALAWDAVLELLDALLAFPQVRGAVGWVLVAGGMVAAPRRRASPAAASCSRWPMSC